MIVRFAAAKDYSALRDFRRSVFRDELDIQEETYEDVFNDHFSKSILIEREGRLIGSVRFAFSREVQEFYISYLTVAPELRCTGISRALLGAVFVLMKANGVRVVRADAADNNLSMYLSVGCEIVGAPFRKYGFRVEWTPLRYRLGTNSDAEARLMAQVEHSLLSSGDLRWRYSINLRMCSGLFEYKGALLDLVAAKGITADVPHYIHEDGHRRAFQGGWLETSALAVQPGEQDQQLASAFMPLNDHFSREHLIVLRRQSRFADLAVMYSCLTRKRVVYLNSWSDPAPSNLKAAKSVLLVYAPDEIPQVLKSAIFRSNRYRLGVASGRDEEAASWFLLRNYFEFLRPRDMKDCANKRATFYGTYQMFEGLFFSGQNDCFDGAESHAVLSASTDETVPQDAIELFVSLLKAGYTTGDAVRFASLCAKKRLLIAGDPAVRFFPCRPETRKIEEMKMTVLSFPTDEFRPGVTHWFGPADFGGSNRRGMGSGRRGALWTRASCTEASIHHLFEFRKGTEPSSRSWQPFPLLASS